MSYLMTFLFVCLFGAVVNAQSCVVSITSPGATAGNEVIFYLTDPGDVIIATNTTPNFTTPNTGTYYIYGLSYDPTDAPSTIPMAVGESVQDISADGCYNADFLTDFVPVFCECEGEEILALTTGATPGNIVTYVLVDGTGNIAAVDDGGNFGSALATGDYTIHALSYDPTLPPSPLDGTGADHAALVGTDPADIGNPMPGCFNQDFLSDFVWVGITTCELCEPESGTWID